jgi:hypothetical protein
METAAKPEQTTPKAGCGPRPRLVVAADATLHFHAHMIATRVRVAAGNPRGCVIKFL